jgi:predicted adenine nucleotide alpha hydrolase (AANH) superfamily ATPase
MKDVLIKRLKMINICFELGYQMKLSLIHYLQLAFRKKKIYANLVEIKKQEFQLNYNGSSITLTCENNGTIS